MMLLVFGSPAGLSDVTLHIIYGGVEGQWEVRPVEFIMDGGLM